MRIRTGTDNKGFTLIELLVVIAIIALLVGLLLPGLGEARRTARLSKGMSNLKQMGTATQSYTADYEDRLWTFTWRHRENAQQFFTNVAPDPVDPWITQGLTGMPNFSIDAAQWQMAWILRRRGDVVMPIPTGLMPHITYSHLVLQDYLAMQLPDTVVVNPEDRHRMLWATDPKGYFQGLYTPNFGTTGADQRHPFGASYRLVSAHWDRSPVGVRVQYNPQNSGSVLVYNSPTARYGGKRLADVTAPSNKVQMYDTFGRHFGRYGPFQWVSSESSRQPLLMYDGSVNVRVSGDSNPGGNPNDPMNMAAPEKIRYVPSPIEPPVGGQEVLGNPYFTFTRGGLRGIDFGGNEIRTTGY